MIDNWISSGNFLRGLRFNELIGFSQYYNNKKIENWPVNETSHQAHKLKQYTD